MFTWFTGGLLLAWLLCPVAAIVIVKEINRWLRRRAARQQERIAERRRIMRLGGAR